MSADPRAAWWRERNPELGLALALDARRVFHAVTTTGGEVEVLAHERLGRVLAVDGRVHHVEEEPGPREMLVHVPLAGREAAPERVLIVGGGDGFVLREVLLHDAVGSVDVLEPEPRLHDAAAALGHEPALADRRVRVHAALPAAGAWDVVLVDRPLLALASLAARLGPGGLVCECDQPVLGLDSVRWARRGASVERIGHEERYCATGPLAAGGFFGYSLHGHDAASCREPRRAFEGRHYNPELHRAAFALPSFWSELP